MALTRPLLHCTPCHVHSEPDDPADPDVGHPLLTVHCCTIVEVAKSTSAAQSSLLSDGAHCPAALRPASTSASAAAHSGAEYGIVTLPAARR